jgi:hypothetical protein
MPGLEVYTLPVLTNAVVFICYFSFDLGVTDLFPDDAGVEAFVNSAS